MPEIVCNTSPLLYLHQLGQIDLLHLLYGEVVVPGAVLREIDEGARRNAAVPLTAELPWIKPATVDDATLLRIVADLGAGEREVLALGLERPGTVVILDDGRARRYAKMLGLRLTGTLGILVRAKQRGLIPAVTPLVERLEVLRFHLDATTHAAILNAAGE